jgi:uncharacterized membrane protein YoaK (UPF0700 family)
MLVSFVDELVDDFLRGDRTRRPFVLLHAGVWLAFAAGACAGTVAFLRMGAAATLFAAIAVGLVILRDVAAPVAAAA